MKKIILLVLVFCLSISSAFAGDFSFAFEDARFHSDLLGGFAPVYVRAGVDYTGIELIDEQRTDLYLIGGGALISSSIWSDQQGLPFEPSSVENTTDLFKDYNAYSKWQADLSLKLKQGLIHDAERGRAFLAVYGKYAFHYTAPHENLYDGAAYSNFLSGDAAAYPDKNGTATNLLQTGFEISSLDHTDTYNGYTVDGSVKWAPRWFLNEIRGTSDFVNLNLTAKGYYSIIELKRKDSELALIGIYLADRVQVDYTAGDAIPQFYQEQPALGSKMRGFESNSIGTGFTAVNNFDIRIYGPEFLDNINPVVQLFVDTGFAAGKYFNTELVKAGEFLCSTGFEVALNIVDFAQVGYMFGFPLIGTNLQEQSLQSGIMFQYKF